MLINQTSSTPEWTSSDLMNITMTTTSTHNGPNVQQTIIAISNTLIASIGLLGNTLNFIVLYAYHTSQINFSGECSARVNLIGLALADFFVCLTMLPLGFAGRHHATFSIMLIYTIVGQALANYFMTVSVWMVLLMSVVRYLAVCRPLTSRGLLTPKYMLRIIVCVYVAALLFHIPSFLLLTYRAESHDESVQTLNSTPGSVMYVIYEREFWTNPIVDYCYYVISIIYTNLGPFVGVVISNLAVIRACRRSDAQRQSFADRQYGNQYAKRGSEENASNTRQIPQFIHNKQRNLINHGVNTSLRDYHLPASRIMMYKTSNPQYRLSLNRYPNRATNRVTPLLLAVIFAFLIFNAPFGIIHFVCIRIVRGMGTRIRDDPQARRLYIALDSTVEWTNVVQLLGFACNFFLYFLVSITFRRTAKRTFAKCYKNLKSCKSELLLTCFWFDTSKCTPSSSCNRDTRTDELRRALDLNLNDHCGLQNGRITATPSRAERLRIFLISRSRNTNSRLHDADNHLRKCIHAHPHNITSYSQTDVSTRRQKRPLKEHMSDKNSSSSQCCPHSNPSPMSLPNVSCTHNYLPCTCGLDPLRSQHRNHIDITAPHNPCIFTQKDSCLCECSCDSTGNRNLRVVTA